MSTTVGSCWGRKISRLFYCQGNQQESQTPLLLIAWITSNNSQQNWPQPLLVTQVPQQCKFKLPQIILQNQVVADFFFYCPNFPTYHAIFVGYQTAGPNYIAIVVAIVCIIALMLPSNEAEGGSSTSMWSMFHLSSQQKLVFAYSLGKCIENFRN